MNDCQLCQHVAQQVKRHNTYANCTSSSLRTVDLALLVVASNFGRVLSLELLPHILLPTAELRRVDGDEQRLDAPTFCVLHELLRDRAILVDVQLQELDLSGLRCVDELVECA